jgi:hypothetical protein
LQVLRNEAATRQAIIEGFRHHLSQAGKEDVALFYYSGHGSQAPSPPEFWHLEPDRLDETLVCYDSRLPGQWDLADKELAQLLAEVAANGPHTVVMLDCCHSGSGTRAPRDDGVRIRHAPTDTRDRPIETFIVRPPQAQQFSQVRGSAPGGGWYTLPRGRHIVFSACSAEEEAKEMPLSGKPCGVFSYYLLETLECARENLTYRELFKRANALVRARVAVQSPQMEATHAEDLNQPFLGGAIAARPTDLTVSHDKQRGWVIDAGAVHGIPAPDGEETTRLALFPFDANLDSLNNLAGTIGEARVRQVFPAQSAVAATLHNGEALDPTMTYKGVVMALPLSPLVVAFEGNEAALALVRQVMATAGPDDKPSLLVREGQPEEAELLLSAQENRYRIRRQGDGYALVVDTIGFNESSAALVVQRLEHIACWRKIVELANPASRIKAEDARLEILRPDKNGTWQPVAVGSNVRLEYEFKEGGWQQPQFKIKLINTAERRLYCLLLDLPETYGVFPMLPGGGVWLHPGQEAWANHGEPLYAEVLDELWQQGVVEFKDTLKLIVSTDESDATLLQQEDLPVTVIFGVNKGVRAIAPMSTLNRLMQRVQTRRFSSEPAGKEAFSDWRSTEISFTTVRPLEAADIAKPGQRVSLGQGVTVLGHPRLQARARLTSVPQAARDAGNLTLPAWLRDHPDTVQPFEFSTSRSGEPGLSVLELVDVTDSTVITPTEPLIVEIGTPLEETAYLLPLGHDGEFFMPLGRVEREPDGIRIILERLPAPTSHGARDLKGSIKILFQKLVGQRLGWQYLYPLLRVAEIAEDGTVTYSAAGDDDSVRSRIAAAGRILLYMHGIIGDTRIMAASARPGWLKLPTMLPALVEKYDLILTFDYENLHTSIEDNARLLKQRLAALGLPPNHGKTLHVVAHSMGGLVSRWFIEREGGNQVIQRLVMLGTPNGGSP